MLIDSGCKIRYFIDGNNTILEIFLKNIAVNKKIRIFAAAFDARNLSMVSVSNHAEVAESVDASVSKTDEVTLVPVRSRPSVLEKASHRRLFYLEKILIFALSLNF